MSATIVTAYRKPISAFITASGMMLLSDNSQSSQTFTRKSSMVSRTFLTLDKNIKQATTGMLHVLLGGQAELTSMKTKCIIMDVVQ